MQGQKAKKDHLFPGIPSSLDLQHNIVTSGKADWCVSRAQTGWCHHMAREASCFYSSTASKLASKLAAWDLSFPMSDNFRDVSMCSSVKSIQNHSGFISVGV